MRLATRSVITGVTMAGLLVSRVLLNVYRQVQFFRMIAMVDPPVWVLYPAILLHVIQAGRRRTDAQSADGLVTSVFV